MQGFRRRLRLRCSRFRRLGKLRLAGLFLLLAAAIAFHITIACHFVDVQPDDSKLYVQLARNMIEQGVFSGESAAPFLPTLIRTPGYPIFLAEVFEMFGVGNETAIRVIQGLAYTLTCIFAALIAFQWVEDRTLRSKAAIATFILTAFCPFTVIFSAAILAEMLTMFLLAATMLAATNGIKARKKRRSLIWWAAAGLLAGINVLARPDAGLFALGIGLTLVISIFFGRESFKARLADRFVKGILFAALFALPLVPWTIRNERVFSVFQPLSPAHAEMPGEFVPRGYFLWLRTWIDDSKYIDPLIWGLEKNPLQIEDVPPYAFSSDDEQARVAALFDQYNNSDPDHPAAGAKKTDEDDSDDDSDDKDANAADNADDKSGDGDQADTDAELDLKISSEADAAFAEIGNERVAREPWHYYAWLPLKRSASMWFDTHSDYYPFGGELLPLTDLDNTKDQQIWLPLFAGLDWLYTLAAIAGCLVLLFFRRSRYRLWLFMVLAVCGPRALFFGTIENPEPRYLVELFIPAAILGGIVLAHLRLRRGKGSIGLELHYGND